MDGASRYVTGASGVGANNKTSEPAMWSYAVPSQNEVRQPLHPSNNERQTDSGQNAPEYDSRDSYGNGLHDDRKPLSQSHNSNSARTSQPGTIRSKPSLENAGFRNNDYGEPVETNGADQPDSPYANGATAASGNNRKRVTSRERSRVRRKGSRGAVNALDEGKQDTSKWIHRDKLAQIESRELAELGVRMGGKSSRSGSRRAKSTKTDRSVVEADDSMRDEIEEEDPLTEEESRYPNNGTDAESFTQATSQRNDERPSTARSGGSRIPIPTSTSASPEDADSPLEISHRRSSSLPRPMRKRSQSQNSQNVLEKQNKSGPTSPTSPNAPANRGVPVNAKTRKASTTSRKNSGQDGARSRSNSVTDSPRRPGTSGGDSRPPTARPDGDAPWVVNSYKPDPRLPPDQQMLPTHAKRMAEMQRQAEEEARTRKAQRQQEEEYTLMDSDDYGNANGNKESKSSPVKEAFPPQNKTAQRQSVQQARQSYQQNRDNYQHAAKETDNQDAQWPLRTPSGHIVNGPQDRNATASPTKSTKRDSAEHGGYNLIPNVSPVKDQSPRIDQRTSMRSTHTTADLTEKEREANTAMAPVNQPVRLQDPEEKGGKEEDKGCLKCCVVM